MAREHGVEDLLPETTKGTEYRLAHRVEHGLRVKGTGVGQKVKGHIHERHMIAKYAFSVGLATSGAFSEQYANHIVQDGGEKESNDGDAKAHQSLEEGKSNQISHVTLSLGSKSCTNQLGRWERETGPNGPNKHLDRAKN
jgi:hypothetical protein